MTENLKSQFFGIEIEMAGITRDNAARIIAEYFGTTSSYYGGNYYEHHVMDEQNRKWKLVYDSSIPANYSDQKTELVSPICTYDDIPKIQEIARKLRAAGAITPHETGIHVHVNGAPFDANSIKNITNIMFAKEEMIYKALKVSVERQDKWCKPAEAKFINDLYTLKPKSIEQIKDLWYNGADGSGEHYHSSRYYCLNLHALFSKGTIEFRLFNSTLHGGLIRSYITLSLAISNQALSQNFASRLKTTSDNEKYTFRTWLLRLGLIGDEFKNVRMHLLKNLDGNIAWKNPEDAIKQRERLKAEREISKQNTPSEVPVSNEKQDLTISM